MSSQCPEPPASEARLLAISKRLMEWTTAHLPAFPWRDESSPYAVWIAVVMLQQTQVATMLPYYRRFMERFPTLDDLASASLGDVLKAWEGLGYYARARNLRRTARIVAREMGSRLPQDRRQLIGLPGIGDYTAGAILSIAFGADEPAIDGNVRRVLCRLFAIDEDTRRRATMLRLHDAAKRLLPAGRSGAFNQGLMEFGAAICTAQTPDCDDCTLHDLCLARQLGRVSEIPHRPERRQTPEYVVTAALTWNADGEVLLARRPTDVMLGGLWEFPGGKREEHETLKDCLRREMKEELGIDIKIDGPAATVRHAYSHFRIVLHAFHCRPAGGEPQALGCSEFRWVAWSDLASFAISGADRKIIAKVGSSRLPEAPPTKGSQE